MNDDLGPEDRTLGTALSRAIEAQSVRATRFEDSRLGVNMNKPKRGSFLLPAFATVAAVLVGLVVGLTLLDRGAAPSQVATSPTPTATPTAAGIASPAPTSGPTQAPAEQFVVWFARDQLPPVPTTVSGPGPSGAQSADRISARVRALWDAPSQGDAYNEFRTRPNTSLKSVTTTVSGDLATVVIDAGRWDGLSSAETIAVVQQLVYTITEEPGIRRAALREPGKDHAEIGGGMQKDPMTREDVSGYDATTDERIVAEDVAVPATATATASNDGVAPALGRLAIELRASSAPTGGFWSPRFSAQLRPNELPADPKFVQGKWILDVTVPGAVPGGAPIGQISGAPITDVRSAQSQSAVVYSVGLTDARPWRISMEPGSAAGTVRLLVDIGGHPEAVAQGTVVYSPRQNADVSRQITVNGAARAFEATVSWRVRDAAGREVAKGFTNATVGTGPVWGTFRFQVQLPATVSGNVTLDVFQASPRDGSDTNKVEIRLQVR